MPSAQIIEALRPLRGDFRPQLQSVRLNPPWPRMHLDFDREQLGR
jgi:hypothetical protein